MNYWLFKSEPQSWSWRDQEEKGASGQEWDGVRNYQARNHMRAMQVGDRGLFYHSGSERRIAGIVEVIGAAHPDSTDASGTWDCVDIRALAAMPQPVTLEAVKAQARLASMALVANSRLSVQPVRADEWRLVCEMGGLGA